LTAPGRGDRETELDGAAGELGNALDSHAL
jgi:hypothetical protein